MREFTLVRLTQDLATPQRGVLLHKGEPRWVTLELPWYNNERNISCVPPGEYVCTKVTNRRLAGGGFVRTTFEVQNVPHRDGILFHSGNTAQDTQGCILLGGKFGGLRLPAKKVSNTGRKYYDGDNITMAEHRAILASKEAFDQFIALTFKDDEIKLKITRYYDEPL